MQAQTDHFYFFRPIVLSNQPILDPGWFHLAAAVLAVEHFNSRNESIVKELGDLQNCGITFGNVVAVDTGTNSHQAMDYVVDQLLEMGHAGVVDAIAGPFNEVPALELSVMATWMRAPIVAHAAYDSNLLDPARHPYYSQVCGDFHSEMQFIANYLLHLKRHNYIAVLYSSTASEIQKADILTTILKMEGFDQVRTFGYKASGPEEAASGSVRDALDGIKETGYRTIVTLPAQLGLDMPLIGKSAIDLSMDQGSHLWVISGGDVALTTLEVYDFVTRSDEMNATILKGSAYVYAIDDTSFYDFPEGILQTQDRLFFDRVQKLNPVPFDITKDSSVATATFPIQKMAEISSSWMRVSVEVLV
jgi:Receptor family ligand binding region